MNIEHINKYYVDKCAKFVYPQRMDAWKTHIFNIYNTDKSFYTDYLIIQIAMENLEKGKSVEEVNDYINSLDSLVFSKDIVYKTLLLFSKRGPEFYRKAKGGLLNTAEKYVKAIERENKRFCAEPER